MTWVLIALAVVLFFPISTWLQRGIPRRLLDLRFSIEALLKSGGSGHAVVIWIPKIKSKFKVRKYIIPLVGSGLLAEFRANNVRESCFESLRHFCLANPKWKFEEASCEFEHTEYLLIDLGNEGEEIHALLMKILEEVVGMGEKDTVKTILDLGRK